MDNRRRTQMIRRAAAILFALTLNPALLHAEDTVLTITAQSADVHRGPSIATPVIGHASQGTILAVLRNLGSWVKVAWPDAPDAIGYVHVTMGRLGAPGANGPSANSSARTSYISVPTPMTTMSASRMPAPVVERTTVIGQQGGATISHIVGVGGLVGPMRSFGATARGWRHNRVGFQVGITREVMKSEAASGRVTSMQIEPAVVYALFDRVHDYVWVRPYVGSALSFGRQTLNMQAPGPTDPVSDRGIGFRVFGGSELTFATVTRFGLSAELGYRRVPTPFAGFAADRMSVS